MHLYSRSLFLKPKYSHFSCYTRRPLLQYKPNSLTATKSSSTDLIETTSRLIGNSIGTYVLVFCSLQWWFYRQINKNHEE